MTRREEIEAELARQAQIVECYEKLAEHYNVMLQRSEMCVGGARQKIRALNLELTKLGIDEAAEAMRVKL